MSDPYGWTNLKTLCDFFICPGPREKESFFVWTFNIISISHKGRRVGWGFVPIRYSLVPLRVLRVSFSIPHKIKGKNVSTLVCFHFFLSYLFSFIIT